MLALLVAIRDFLLAAALAWVGVTLEAVQHADRDARCSADACQQHDQQH